MEHFLGTSLHNPYRPGPAAHDGGDIWKEDNEQETDVDNEYETPAGHGGAYETPIGQRPDTGRTIAPPQLGVAGLSP